VLLLLLCLMLQQQVKRAGGLLLLCDAVSSTRPSKSQLASLPVQVVDHY